MNKNKQDKTEGKTLSQEEWDKLLNKCEPCQEMIEDDIRKAKERGDYQPSEYRPLSEEEIEEWLDGMM